MSYIGNIPVPQATQTRDRFTATSGQTTFATSGYTPGFLDVYLNGVHLDASDYTATNGSDVVLDTGAATDDIVEVVAFTAFNVSEKLPDQTGNAGEYLTTDGSALSWGTITDPTPAAVSGQANTATDFFALPSGTTAQRPGSPSNGYIRYNTTEDYIEEYRGGAWHILSTIFTATGGTVTESGGYKIHTFTSSGTFTVESGTAEVEYLVIAGGGGGGRGGNPGGGGGAGGYRSSVSGESSGGGASAETALYLTTGNHTVTIGAGGSPDNNGSNSVFSTITSTGGGSGSPAGNLAGNSGGSGGGASHGSTGGAGTSGQGYKGGDTGGYSGGVYATGGGGGASAAGDAGNVSSGKSGNGGNGVSSSITGSAVTRAGGGGGSMYSSGTRGFGGSGGGGDGGSSSSNAISATANTGGGGGGYSTGNSGGNGGSGIVIIRYEI